MVTKITKPTLTPVKELTLLAVLLAMEIVLARFLVIPLAPYIRLSFAFLPLAIASRRSIGGGVAVGGLADILGTVFFPAMGAYYPGFTVTEIVSAVIYGLLLQGDIKGNKGIIKIVIAAVSQQILCSVLLNSLWFSYLYGKAYSFYLVSRLVLAAIMIPTQIFTLILLLPVTDKALIRV